MRECHSAPRPAVWGRQGRPPPARVPGRRVKPGAPVTQQPRAGWPPRAARSPVEMIHHTEQHQGVDHHLLHRQLRHRDSARPPAGPAPCDPQTPATAAIQAAPPGPSASPSGLAAAAGWTSAPRVLRARARSVARAAILRKGKGRLWELTPLRKLDLGLS